MLDFGEMVDRSFADALGRAVEYYDAPAVRALERESAGEGYRFSSIIRGIVKSTPFRMRWSES